MYTVSCQKLTAEAFKKYGSYANMLEPDGEKLAPGVIEFYRDLLPLPVKDNVVASVTKIDNRPYVVEKWEYHTTTGEAFMPIDGDVIACFVPAGRGQKPEPQKTEAFLIPRGTMVTIRAGVWHQAPYACEGKQVHNLVFLPERTYANDCFVVLADEQEKIEIIRE